MEPFGGSGAILLNKPRHREELLNDLNGDIINFFQVLKNKEQREDFLDRLLHTRLYSPVFCNAETDDPVDRAYAFVYRQHCAYCGKDNGFAQNSVKGAVSKTSGLERSGQKLGSGVLR